MVKKCILALSLTLCLASLTGCGHKEEAPEPEIVEETPVQEVQEKLKEKPAEESNAEENVIQSTGNPASDKLSLEAILALAKKHSGAPYSELDHITEDGHLVICLYDQSEDGNMDVWDWYEIDPETLRGKNFMQEDIYLPELSVAQDPWQAAPLINFQNGQDLKIKFMFTNEIVEIVLLSPSGKTYMRESTEPSGKNGDLEWIDSEAELYSIYAVKNAEHGLWIAQYRLGTNSSINVEAIEE